MTFSYSGHEFVVKTLSRHNFTGLTTLRSLALTKCGLEIVEADAFSDLKQLKYLDLSNNALVMIEDYTFSGLNLDNLFLHNNPRLFLSDQAFVDTRIKHLSLRHCDLEYLNSAAIAPLSNSLENLLLDNNKLTFLDESIFNAGFPKLKSLFLSNNPWHCSCEMRWLKQLQVTNETLFSQDELSSLICQSPEPVSRFSFQSLHLADFGCQAPLFNDISIIFHAEKAELSCTVQSSSATSVFWLTPSGTRHVYQPEKQRSNQRITNAKLVVPRPPLIQGNVETPSNKRLTYRCVASNFMGNVSANVDVVWPPPVRIQNPQQMRQKNDSSEFLVLGANPAICVDTMAIVGAIVGTFAFTLVTILVALLITRRVRAYWRRRNTATSFLHRRDPPCWGTVMTAGKLVGHGTGLRPGSAGASAATPLVLNTSSGSSSSSSRQSNNGQFIYHPANTFHPHHAANLDELSNFVDPASSPSNGSSGNQMSNTTNNTMMSLPLHTQSSMNAGFTYHAPSHKQMQVSLINSTSQYSRTNMR